MSKSHWREAVDWHICRTSPNYRDRWVITARLLPLCVDDHLRALRHVVVDPFGIRQRRPAHYEDSVVVPVGSRPRPAVQLAGTFRNTASVGSIQVRGVRNHLVTHAFAWRPFVWPPGRKKAEATGATPFEMPYQSDTTASFRH